MKLKLVYHYDFGHGWLAVKRKLLEEWGLLGKITPYSYQRGQTVYLEEDEDMTTFCDEAKRRGVELEWRNSYQYHTPIRFYDGFCA